MMTVIVRIGLSLTSSYLLCIQKKYTSPTRMAIEGRSAGGLLMGAVTNMRPDLFNAVLMGVPFVDW